MEKKLPNSTKVVVIGGGVVGCSVAYHLAKFGWKDTILLERDQLTSGTTWHAAGLVSQLGPSAAITKIRKYTLDLYKELEKKVDHSAGLRLNGALSIAETKGRWQELQRQATTAQLYDVDVKILDKDQIKKDYPIVNTDDVIGGILMPGDGAADPSGVTHMLAKAARIEGAKIFEKSPVEEIITKDGTKIKSNQDIIEVTGRADKILTCERTALNILTRMSGIATQTNELVKKIPNKTKLYATRKTAPGLRYFDKEAVKIGGGERHRLRLDEMVMIKDNHIAVEQSLSSLINKTKKKYKKFEVEVENTDDAVLAAEKGATIIMLDNFSPSQITRTIKVLKNKKLRNKVLLEASGGINSKNISKYGKTDVDIISIGSITNSVKGIDFSLEI